MATPPLPSDVGGYSLRQFREFTECLAAISQIHHYANAVLTPNHEFRTDYLEQLLKSHYKSKVD